MIIMETADIPEASHASYPNKSLPCCMARAFIEGLKFVLEAFIAVISPAMEIAGAFFNNFDPLPVILLVEGQIFIY